MDYKLKQRLGDYMSVLIKDRGYTVNAFSDEFGLSAPYLTKVLNGRANIGIDQLNKYAQCFNMTLEAFLYPVVEGVMDSETMELLSVFESCDNLEKAEIVGYTKGFHNGYSMKEKGQEC